jgi:hypothetical protein
MDMIVHERQRRAYDVEVPYTSTEEKVKDGGNGRRKEDDGGESAC